MEDAGVSGLLGGEDCSSLVLSSESEDSAASTVSDGVVSFRDTNFK